MKLLIISNMAHYLRDGTIVGHGPTAREISYLAELFDSVRHIGCLFQTEAPAMALPYETDKVTLVSVPPSGGDTIKGKLSGLWLIPRYSWAILRELQKADVVHVRAPANIPMLALFWLMLLPYPRQRWLKYAGSWQITSATSRLSRIQKWWLKVGLSRGKVTVNGEWPDQPKHVVTFFNPCLTSDELRQGRQAAESKQLGNPIQLLFVGRIEAAKGADHVLYIVKKLRDQGIDFTLDLVGGGPEQAIHKQLASDLGIQSCVTFYEPMPRPQLSQFYAESHILVLPSQSEGWPKVISEAMAYGVVPLASNVGSIPQYLARFETGRSLDTDDTTGFADAIQFYTENASAWKRESDNAVKNAHYFSYTHYLDQVKTLLELPDRKQT